MPSTSLVAVTRHRPLLHKLLLQQVTRHAHTAHLAWRTSHLAAMKDLTLSGYAHQTQGFPAWAIPRGGCVCAGSSTAHRCRETPQTTACPGHHRCWQALHAHTCPLTHSPAPTLGSSAGLGPPHSLSATHTHMRVGYQGLERTLTHPNDHQPQHSPALRAACRLPPRQPWVHRTTSSSSCAHTCPDARSWRAVMRDNSANTQQTRPQVEAATSS